MRKFLTASLLTLALTLGFLVPMLVFPSSVRAQTFTAQIQQFWNMLRTGVLVFTNLRATGGSITLTSETANLLVANTSVTSPLYIAGSGGTMTINGATIASQFQVNINGQSVFESHSFSANAADAPAFYGARSRGTIASPAIVQNGDVLASYAAVGNNGIAPTTYSLGGYMNFVVGATPGAADMPTDLHIALSPDGSQTPTDRLVLKNDGTVQTGTVTTGVWNGTAVAATFGGTGQIVYAVGDLLSADTTTTLSKIPAVAAGQVFASAGTGTLPGYTANPVVTCTGIGGSVSTGAGVSLHCTKIVTAIPNNMATTVLTWSAPNAQVSALIKINVMGALGAGGAVGAGECARSIEFPITVTRTPNANAVSAVASAAEDTGNATVAGGSTCTIARSVVAVSGASNAVNTQQVQINITAATGSSTNHTATIEYWIINNTANGVTIS